MVGGPLRERRSARPFSRSHQHCVPYPEAIRRSIGILADALPPILQMLIAKEFKFVPLRDSKLRYRSARITGVRLEMRLDEDDMPADDARVEGRPPLPGLRLPSGPAGAVAGDSPKSDFRFSPDSGLKSDIAACLLSADCVEKLSC